jgi:voltage-gated potassium channel Kch
VLAWQRRANRVWRRRFLPLAHRQRTIILPLLAVAVIVLGVVGYTRYHLPNGPHPGFWESLYHTIALFGLNGGLSVPPAIPWEFQVARFLAPLLLFYAAVQAIIRISREPFQLATIRALARDHIVIAGLGDVGGRLASAFHDADEYVVVIEADPNHPRLEDFRHRGIRIITGSAVSPRVLAQARLDRARHLVVACGRDALNVDIAAVAESTVRGRDGVLTAFAHLRDLRLWRMLKAEAVAIINEPEFRLEFFNVFVTAARVMLERHPPFDGAAAEPELPHHICFVGLDGVGEELVLSVAGMWRNRASSGQRLPVTLAGPAADEDYAMLLARYPELADIVDLRHHRADIASAAFQSGSVLLDEDGRCTVTRVYISLESDAEALAAALGLHGSPDTMQVPIVVAVTDTDAGTAEVLAGEQGRVAAVEPFGVLSEALTPEIVLRGMNEALARSKHNEYLDLRRQQGTFDPREPSNQPWEHLPEVFKASNRRFADRIGRKLQDGGWGIIPAPLIDVDAPAMALGDEEVEALARIEHDGWVADLLRDGWKPTTGPKDPEHKLHPMLVSWEELSEEERDKDRSPVRELPRMLARAGFELYRQSEGVAAPVQPAREPTAAPAA